MYIRIYMQSVCIQIEHLLQNPFHLYTFIRRQDNIYLISEQLSDTYIIMLLSLYELSTERERERGSQQRNQSQFGPIFTRTNRLTAGCSSSPTTTSIIRKYK